MALSKRLLFLNRSFYPDVEATGQLLTELCGELAKDFEIHILCGNPLYRKVKRRGLVHKTSYNHVTVWRVNNTTFSKKHFFPRLINLFSYYILCFIWVFFLKKIDCVIAETDPPLLASIAYVYSRIRGCPFIYYSQDIWPQVGIATGRFSYPLLVKILKKINGFLYSQAHQIVIPGRDMKERLEEEHHIPSLKIAVVENWADPSEIYPINRDDNPFIPKNSLHDKFVVMYSGNIGFSQDLESVMHAADSLKDLDDILFLLIGEGALKDRLTDTAASLGLRNIKFLSYQEKKDLKYSLSAAHIHLVPLKKGMKGYIVPSKVYGIMASGRPFIAAADKGSEIDQMVEEFRCGIRIRPSNVKELKEAILWAYRNEDELETMGERGRKAMEDRYTIKTCAQKFKKRIENVI